jgi:hypothetical protein
MWDVSVSFVKILQEIQSGRTVPILHYRKTKIYNEKKRSVFWDVAHG